jgi:hypothetical protein
VDITLSHLQMDIAAAADAAATPQKKEKKKETVPMYYSSIPIWAPRKSLH